MPHLGEAIHILGQALSAEAREIVERRMEDPGEFLFPSPTNPERPLSGNLPLWHEIRRFFIMDLHGFRLATQCLGLEEFVKRRHRKAGQVVRGPEPRLPAWAASPRSKMVKQGGHRSRVD